MDTASNVKNFLQGWRDTLAPDEDSFPTMEQLMDCPWGYRPSRGRIEEELIRLVDEGFIGMDGFRYCWPQTARQNWRVCHQ